VAYFLRLPQAMQRRLERQARRQQTQAFARGAALRRAQVVAAIEAGLAAQTQPNQGMARH